MRMDPKREREALIKPKRGRPPCRINKAYASWPVPVGLLAEFRRCALKGELRFGDALALAMRDWIRGRR